MTDDDLQTACENVAGFLQAELYRQKVPAPIRIEPPEVRLDPPVIRRTDPEGLLETLSQPLPARLHGAAAEMVQRFKVAGVSMLGSDELADLQRRAAERDLLLAEIEADDVAVALDRMRSTAATLKTLDGILGAFEEPEKCDSTEPKIVRRARGAVEMLGLPMALLRQQAAAVAKPTLDAVESERVRAVQRIRELEAEVVSLREQRERVGDEPGRLTHFIASDGRLAQHCIAGEPVAVAAIRLLDLARKRIAELQKERDEAEERARSALELREDMRRLTTEPIVKIAAAVHMQDAKTAAEVADAAVARIEALERDVQTQAGKIRELDAETKAITTERDAWRNALLGLAGMGLEEAGAKSPADVADLAWARVGRPARQRAESLKTDRDNFLAVLRCVGVDPNAVVAAFNRVTSQKVAVPLSAAHLLARRHDLAVQIGEVSKALEGLVDPPEHDDATPPVVALARKVAERVRWLRTRTDDAVDKLEAQLADAEKRERTAHAGLVAWRAAMHRVAALVEVEKPSTDPGECEDQLKVAIRADGTWLTDRTCDGP